MLVAKNLYRPKRWLWNEAYEHLWARHCSNCDIRRQVETRQRRSFAADFSTRIINHRRSFVRCYLALAYLDHSFQPLLAISVHLFPLNEAQTKRCNIVRYKPLHSAVIPVNDAGTECSLIGCPLWPRDIGYSRDIVVLPVFTKQLNSYACRVYDQDFNHCRTVWRRSQN